MKWCDDGVTREVFLVGRFAVKIPKLIYGWRNFLQGLLANMQEQAFRQGEWPDLCPIVFSIPGGWLVVMRRADPVPEDRWSAFLRDRLGADAIRTIHPRDEIRSWNGGDYTVPVEVKRSSFGLLDGRIVAIDYGN